MEVQNEIKIAYLESGNLLIKCNVQHGETLYDDVLDALGDVNVVTCNEINGNESDMLIDGDRDIYLFQLKEMNDLAEYGETELVRQGTLKDFIDLEDESHIDFIRWYYGYDDSDEAINAMKSETFI